MTFIDDMRVESFTAESILRVLHQQGLEIAARIYRAWKRSNCIAAHTVTDALVEDQTRAPTWKANEGAELFN